MGVAAVFLAAFAFLAAGAAPAVAPRDAADMAAAALTLGVAHPPGYPLYALLGRAWLELLPFGGEGYRLALLSCAAGAGACAALYAALARRAGVLGGLCAAAVWLTSAPLWKFSLLQEKYALHALAAAVLLLLSEGESGNLWRRVRLSGFLLGLGLVNHQSLLLWLPGLAWLWREEARRHGAAPGALARAGLPWLAAGLTPYAFLWIRLGSLPEALATALRAQYGSGTLYAGLARPLDPVRAAALFGWSLAESARAAGWAAAAAAGAALFLPRAERGPLAGLVLGGLAAGPGFVLLARFDHSDWVARTALEPAFLLPALALAAGAGLAAGALTRRRTAAGAALALLVLVPLGRPACAERRDDFLAEDYARNLRRALPPGAELLAGGDTALFGLRWRALTAPREGEPRVGGAALLDARAWLGSRAAGAASYAAGVSPELLRSAGYGAGGRPLTPEGLVVRLGVRPPTLAAPIVLRRPRAWERDESYARDLKLAYAFASWSSARLLEAQGLRPPVELDLRAAALDPADYSLE